MSTDIVPMSTAVGSALQSNMPAEHKTHIRRLFERVHGPIQTAKKTAVTEGGEIVKASVAGTLVGIGFALSNHYLGGLDVGARKDVPVDLLAYGASSIVALGLSANGGDPAIANYAAAASLARFVERKLTVGLEKSLPAAAHGDSGLVDYVKRL